MQCCDSRPKSNTKYLKTIVHPYIDSKKDDVQYENRSPEAANTQMGWKKSVRAYKFQWSACWCMQAARVRNAGIQKLVATSPSHQETLELLKGKAKTTHLRLHTFSHIRSICYLYYVRCLISLSRSCIRFQKTHTYAHNVITTCRLSYLDLCALDCRAGLWCIVHNKPWFNNKKQRKST